MEKALYDRMAAIDDRNWIFYGKSVFMAPFLGCPRTGAILDAGCGTGPLVNFLRQRGEVIGMDRSSYALSAARRTYASCGVRFVEGDIAKIPFDDGFFDVVVLSDVLYHRDIADEALAVRECRRVLKEGGLIIVFDSAFSFLKTSYDKEALASRRYTLGQMKEKLITNGFHVEKASYVFFFILPVVMAARFLKGALNLKFNEEDGAFSLSAPLNGIMRWIMALESLLLRVGRLPFGVSVFCVGTKRSGG